MQTRKRLLIRSLYCALAWPFLAWPGQNGTFVLKSMGGFEQVEWSPSTYFTQPKSLTMTSSMRSTPHSFRQINSYIIVYWKYGTVPTQYPHFARKPCVTTMTSINIFHRSPRQRNRKLLRIIIILLGKLCLRDVNCRACVRQNKTEPRRIKSNHMNDKLLQPIQSGNLIVHMKVKNSDNQSLVLEIRLVFFCFIFP